MPSLRVPERARRVVRLMVTSIAAGGVLFGLNVPTVQASEAADARIMGWPTECHDVVPERITTHALAECGNANGGRYQAIVICEGGIVGRVHRLGGWRSGGQSIAYCQGSEYAVGSGINTSPDPL